VNHIPISIPPSKYGPTGRAYGPTHYGMGHTTMTLTFKTDHANEGLNPVAQDQGHRHHNQQRLPTNWERSPAPIQMPRRHQENGSKTMTKATASSRCTGQLEPPPCQQRRHDQHYSITPCHATTWEPDHENNHTRTCADARTRQLSLQAQLTSFSLL
jgi:hypothetical protein